MVLGDWLYCKVLYFSVSEAFIEQCYQLVHEAEACCLSTLQSPRPTAILKRVRACPSRWDLIVQCAISFHLSFINTSWWRRLCEDLLS